MCAGTKGPEMDIYIYLCVLLQETNHVKRAIKSLIVGTTSLYKEENVIVPPIVLVYHILVLVWVRNARTWHASCIPELVDRCVV